MFIVLCLPLRESVYNILLSFFQVVGIPSVDASEKVRVDCLDLS